MVHFVSRMARFFTKASQFLKKEKIGWYQLLFIQRSWQVIRRFVNWMDDTQNNIFIEKEAIFILIWCIFRVFYGFWLSKNDQNILFWQFCSCWGLYGCENMRIKKRIWCATKWVSHCFNYIHLIWELNKQWCISEYLWCIIELSMNHFTEYSMTFYVKTHRSAVHMIQWTTIYIHWKFNVYVS